MGKKLNVSSCRIPSISIIPFSAIKNKTIRLLRDLAYPLTSLVPRTCCTLTNALNREDSPHGCCAWDSCDEVSPETYRHTYTSIGIGFSTCICSHRLLDFFLTLPASATLYTYMLQMFVYIYTAEQWFVSPLERVKRVRPCWLAIRTIILCYDKIDCREHPGTGSVPKAVIMNWGARVLRRSARISRSGCRRGSQESSLFDVHTCNSCHLAPTSILHFVLSTTCPSFFSFFSLHPAAPHPNSRFSHLHSSFSLAPYSFSMEFLVGISVADRFDPWVVLSFLYVTSACNFTLVTMSYPVSF